MSCNIPRKRATILNTCPPHLKIVTTLSCKSWKSYFSSLQQYDDVRNVTDSTWNKWQTMSQQRFKMTSLCTNWGIKSFATGQLLHLLTRQPLLQIRHILWWSMACSRFVTASLHKCGINWIEVWAAVAPMSEAVISRVWQWSNSLFNVHDEPLHCPDERCQVFVNFISDASEGWQ